MITEQIPPRVKTQQQDKRVQCYEPATMKYLGYFPALSRDEVGTYCWLAGNSIKNWSICLVLFLLNLVWTIDFSYHFTTVNFICLPVHTKSLCAVVRYLCPGINIFIDLLIIDCSWRINLTPYSGRTLPQFPFVHP